MPSPRRRFVRPGRGSRKGTGWARNINSTLTPVPAATKVLFGTFVLSNPGITETIIRTRGRFAVASDAAAATEQQFGAWGMIVVNDLAVAAGVASLPGPGTDRSDDGWFVWESIQQWNEVAGATSVSVVSQSYDFDSKAARRVEEGFTIAIVVENVHATHAFEFAAGMSLLSKVNT